MILQSFPPKFAIERFQRSQLALQPASTALRLPFLPHASRSIPMGHTPALLGCLQVSLSACAGITAAAAALGVNRLAQCHHRKHGVHREQRDPDQFHCCSPYLSKSPRSLSLPCSLFCSWPCSLLR